MHQANLRAFLTHFRDFRAAKKVPCVRNFTDFYHYSKVGFYCILHLEIAGNIKMEWLLKIVVLWFSFDVILVATCWYAATVIRPYCPNWWERVIVGTDPEIKHRGFQHPKLS